MTECGGVIEGEAPPNRGGVREVSQHKGEPITTPHNMQSLQKHTDAQKSMGAYGGVYTPRAYECMGVYKHTRGCMNVGESRHSPSIKTCLPLKSRKKPYLKLNSYT